MTEGEQTRLVAWSNELRAVHARLRAALEVAWEALDDGEPLRDLLLYCHGFCQALSGHHRGEDRHLFPAIAEQHPELRDTLRYLQQDHAMIEHLVGGLQRAVEERRDRTELERHLDGIGAIMESHFRYEERQLLAVLDALRLKAGVEETLGPL